MSTDPRVEAVAEWLYEEHWNGRRWPSEEAMRPRPTFAQLRTGETMKPPAYANTEVVQAKWWLARAADLLATLDAYDADVVGECLCRVGVQECPVHPGRLLAKEQKIAFRKEWDARVDAARGETP